MKYYVFHDEIFLTLESAEQKKAGDAEIHNAIFEGFEDMLADVDEDGDDDIVEKTLAENEEIYEVAHKVTFASGREKTVIEYRIRKGS